MKGKWFLLVLIFVIVGMALYTFKQSGEEEEIDTELNEIVLMVHAMQHMDAMQVQGDLEALAKDMTKASFDYNEPRLAVCLLTAKYNYEYSGEISTSRMIRLFESTASERSWTDDVANYARLYDFNEDGIRSHEEAFNQYISDQTSYKNYDELSLAEIKAYFISYVGSE